MDIPQPARDGRRLHTAAWAVLAAGLVLAYAPCVAEMWTRWFPAWRRAEYSLYEKVVEGQSYYTHAPLVPFVSFVMVLLLLRHTRVPVRPSRLAGGVLLGGSLLLHLAASFARVNFVSGFSLIGVLAGVVLIVWGTAALRRLWFPIAFLFFMVPLPEVTIAQLNFRLKIIAADWGVRLADILGIVAERSGNQVFLLGGKQLVIANVCNGLRTLISLLAFGALYAYVCKLRGAWRIGLFLLTVPVALVSNSVRILGLIAVADIWDSATATGWFHDFSGLMIYVIAFALMFGLERLVLGAREWAGRPATVLPLFHEVRRGPEDAGQWPRLARAWGERAAWAAAGAIVAAGGATLWLNRAVPPQWSGEMVRDSLPRELTVDGRRLTGYDLELDAQTLTILETQDYLFRRFVRPGAPAVDFCVVFSQDNRKGTHPPDICLQGAGEDIVAKGDFDVPMGPDRLPLPCREIVVQTGMERQYFVYTYLCGTSYTRSFWWQQLTIFANGLLARDASGALIRVSTPAADDVAEARRRATGLLGVGVLHLERALRPS